MRFKTLIVTAHPHPTSRGLSAGRRSIESGRVVTTHLILEKANEGFISIDSESRILSKLLTNYLLKLAKMAEEESCQYTRADSKCYTQTDSLRFLLFSINFMLT